MTLDELKYCKVCWQTIYSLWIDKNDNHRGECIDGCKRIEDCKQAMQWEEFKGRPPEGRD